jgi:hypothetical protein
MPNPASLKVEWVVSKAGNWLSFESFNLSSAGTDAGVYLIWHAGNPGRVVKVGQGNIQERLQAHRANRAICSYKQRGELRVTWAVVPAAHRDGVERYLGDYWKPLVAERFPDVVPIAVNQPF